MFSIQLGRRHAHASGPTTNLVRRSPRARLGLPEDAFVVGVVARIQAHRRFDVILKAICALRERGTDARLLVLGRGTRSEEIGVEPARAMGLDETAALFPGYIEADGVRCGAQAKPDAHLNVAAAQEAKRIAPPHCDRQREACGVRKRIDVTPSVYRRQSRAAEPAAITARYDDSPAAI